MHRLSKSCTMTWFPNYFLKLLHKDLKKWAKRATTNREIWRENCYNFDHFLEKQQNILVSELNDFTNQILARKLLQFWSFFKPTKKSWLAKEIWSVMYWLASIVFKDPYHWKSSFGLWQLSSHLRFCHNCHIFCESRVVTRLRQEITDKNLLDQYDEWWFL